MAKKKRSAAATKAARTRKLGAAGKKAATTKRRKAAARKAAATRRAKATSTVAGLRKSIEEFGAGAIERIKKTLQ